MKKVVIHSDGGCHGNPGPGAWAAVLQYGTRKKEICGGTVNTTNNRMELQAAIEAFRALNQPCEVELFTDSKYVKSGIQSWIHSWKRKGWRTAANAPVKNQELWRELDTLASRHKVHWKWLKGHAGHPLNERCDVLARNEIERIKAQLSKLPTPALAKGSVDWDERLTITPPVLKNTPCGSNTADTTARRYLSGPI